MKMRTGKIKACIGTKIDFCKTLMYVFWLGKSWFQVALELSVSLSLRCKVYSEVNGS